MEIPLRMFGPPKREIASEDSCTPELFLWSSQMSVRQEFARLKESAQTEGPTEQNLSLGFEPFIPSQA